MKTKKKSKNETKPQRSLLRTLLKVLWFSAISFAIFIIGVMLIGILLGLAADDSNGSGGIIRTILLAAGILMLFLAGIAFLSWRSKHTILRWTKKSILMLMPLVIIGAILSSLIIYGDRSDTADIQQSDTNLNAISGNQSFIDGTSLQPQLLLDATNKHRSENSKDTLILSHQLNASALKKCEDMVAKNYWSHDDLSGSEPWHFIEETGYLYANAGENLAYGYLSEAEVINGWMRSPEHKDNLLGSDFSEVGYGICKSDDYVGTGKQLIVVQHLASPKAISPTPNSTYKPYVASVCTKITIPYQTKYEYVSYLYEDESNEYGGTDGYIHTCTTDSTGYKPQDVRFEPYNKTIYKGTKSRGPSASELQAERAAQLELERQSRINSCIQQMKRLSPGSSAYMQCYNVQ